MARTTQENVRRRQVFYLPGFDPFPPRRYRELYRRECAAQAAITGATYALSPGTGPGYGWQVAAEHDGIATEARVEVMEWADLVRATMDRSILSTYAQLVRTAATYLRRGTLWRLMSLRKGPVIAAFYPVAMLLGQLLLAVLLAGLVWRLAGAALGPVLAVLPALAVGWAALRLFQRLDRHLFAHYLMHDYAYAASQNGAAPPELDARLSQFAERLRSALQEEDVDEVLVVGHSSGAHLAVQVLARVLRAGLPETAPPLALLTLGQVVPMASFLPEATELREDLALLAAEPRITWIDVSAPGDGCAFALCDPVLVSGVAPTPKLWPLVLSARFSETLAPETWQRLRWRFFRLHFQYLCAFDDPAGYDYFAITAGPRTLADRFSGRAPSPSRIERGVYRPRACAA